MSVEILPTAGRVALAAKVEASRFLFAISRGNPAWDARWTGANPPVPPLEAENVLDVAGYARPTIVDFLREDDTGTIIAEGGARYSVAGNGDEPTRFVRVRLSIPVGQLVGVTIREIGLFIDSVIDPSHPAGTTMVPAEKVTALGSLYQLHWREPYPLEDGSHFARNFIVRL